MVVGPNDAVLLLRMGDAENKFRISWSDRGVRFDNEDQLDIDDEQQTVFTVEGMVRLIFERLFGFPVPQE